MVWGAGFWTRCAKEMAKGAAGLREVVSLAITAISDLAIFHLSSVDASLLMAHLVAQHGVGPSPAPRIRYGALERCLDKLGDRALTAGASVHMPRIGTGEAGGSWKIVGEIVEDTLCRRHVEVVVYDLPSAGEKPSEKQALLSFSKGA